MFFYFFYITSSSHQQINTLTWNIIFADSLKVLSTGESTGMVAVNCSSNWEVSSALFYKIIVIDIHYKESCWISIYDTKYISSTKRFTSDGLKGGSNFREITSSQLMCLKKLWCIICSASSGPDPNLWPTCLYKFQNIY